MLRWKRWSYQERFLRLDAFLGVDLRPVRALGWGGAERAALSSFLGRAVCSGFWGRACCFSFSGRACFSSFLGRA